MCVYVRETGGASSDPQIPSYPKGLTKAIIPSAVCWLKTLMKTMPDNVFEELVVSTHCIPWGHQGKGGMYSFIQFIFNVYYFMPGIGVNGKEKRENKIGNSSILKKSMTQQQNEDPTHPHNGFRLIINSICKHEESGKP